jgi:hypothetical protein
MQPLVAPRELSSDAQSFIDASTAEGDGRSGKAPAQKATNPSRAFWSGGGSRHTFESATEALNGAGGEE